MTAPAVLIPFRPDAGPAAPGDAADLAAAAASAAAAGPVFVACRAADREAAAAAAPSATVLLIDDDAGAPTVASRLNAALRRVPADWVLVLGPDERVTRVLAEAVRAAAGSAGPRVDGFRVPCRLLFMGRQVRHGGLAPAAEVRLVRPRAAAFDGRLAHRRLWCRGGVGDLSAPLLRLRADTVDGTLERLIRQADLESDDWLATTAAAVRGHPGHPALARRAALRRLGPAGPAPGRAAWRLLTMYVLRLGFLDGPAGWHLARLAAGYEYMARLMFEDKLRRAAKFGTQA